MRLTLLSIVISLAVLSCSSTPKKSENINELKTAELNIELNVLQIALDNLGDYRLGRDSQGKSLIELYELEKSINALRTIIVIRHMNLLKIVEAEQIMFAGPPSYSYQQPIFILKDGAIRYHEGKLQKLEIEVLYRSDDRFQNEFMIMRTGELRWRQ